MEAGRARAERRAASRPLSPPLSPPPLPLHLGFGVLHAGRDLGVGLGAPPAQAGLEFGQGGRRDERENRGQPRRAHRARPLHIDVQDAALAGGREDLAREALTRASGLHQQVADLQTQLAALQARFGGDAASGVYLWLGARATFSVLSRL